MKTSSNFVFLLSWFVISVEIMLDDVLFLLLGGIDGDLLNDAIAV